MATKKIDNWALTLVYDYGRLRERLYQTDLEDTETRDTILERIDTIEILLQDDYGLKIPTELSLKN